MSELSIFRASAGSGKTFRLVIEYLKLLIDKPQSYRNILAVTFTNKATSEMKSRIIDELAILAANKPSKYLEVLRSETDANEYNIRRNAEVALGHILHDFNRFSISTIDSFFQMVMRSFARDLGLHGSYEVELDQMSILEEACDRLFSSVETDAELRRWLVSFSEDQLADGKSWQIRDRVLSLGRQIFNEACQDILLDESKAIQREDILEMQKSLRQIRSSFDTQSKTFGKRALDLMEQHNVMLTDFKYGKSSFATYFSALADVNTKKLFAPGKRVHDAIDDIKSWVTNKSAKYADVMACAESGLHQVLLQGVSFAQKNEREYTSAQLALKYLSEFGVITALAQQVREVGKERNVIMLSESNRLLRGIIADNDAPFLYEKVGSYFEHFMLDEFQDTSVMQWENFRPLVQNSLAEDGSSLVVGDIKQSIYRWRNSSWQLLARQLEADVSMFGAQVQSLTHNWRSQKNVVEFNNQFFEESSKLLQAAFQAEVDIDEDVSKVFEGLQLSIEDVYGDVAQVPAAKGEPGYVSIRTLKYEKGENQKQIALEAMVDQIESLQLKGVKASDIVILVRKGSEGAMVADILLQKEQENTNPALSFHVISADSLYIRNGASVRFLISMMRYIMNPTNKVEANAMVHEFSQTILPQLVAIGAKPERITEHGQQQLLFTENEAQDPGIFVEDDIIEDYFPFFNDTESNGWFLSLSRHAVYHVVCELVAHYHLDRLSGEQSGLQAFLDLILDFSRKDSSDLNKFLEWWDMKGSSATIQTANSDQAIQIMTIHKSKGLEFPYVIMPFCSWELTPKTDGAMTSSIMWVSSEEEPYNRLPILPVGFNKQMAKSYFSLNYYYEVFMTYVDNLNMAYVAFTRASRGLILNITEEHKDKPLAPSLKHVGGLIKQTIARLHNFEWDIEADDELSKGSIFIEQKEEVQERSLQLKVSVGKRSETEQLFKIKRKYDDYFQSDGQTEKVNRGKVLHEIFSNIQTTSDVSKALKVIVHQGMITESEIPEYETQIEELLNDERVKLWFSGNYRIYNELTILSKGNIQHRPDRIMIDGDKAIIIDYKSGQKRSKYYNQQVKTYMNLMQKMGYTNVEGYLWYFSMSKIEAVH